jgi:hypothetical protein
MNPNTLTPLLSDLCQAFGVSQGTISINLETIQIPRTDSLEEELTTYSRWLIHTKDSNLKYSPGTVFIVEAHTLLFRQIKLIVKKLRELYLPKDKSTLLGVLSDRTSKVTVIESATLRKPVSTYTFSIEPLNNHEKLTQLGKSFEYEL